MSDWKELPRPATPGPWDVYVLGDEVYSVAEDPGRPGFGRECRISMEQIAALPEYVAEVERLRAWLDFYACDRFDYETERIRSGEWPDGRQA